MQWSLGITAAPRKESHLLGQTIDSLVAAGWESMHVFAEPDTPTPVTSTSAAKAFTVHENEFRFRPWGNFRHALKWLVANEPRSEMYLLCQDDIVVTRGLRGWLAAGNLPWMETGGVISLYCAAPNARADNPAGQWHRLMYERLDNRAYGALAYVFPRGLAVMLAAKDPFPTATSKVDINVGKWCKANGINYWLHSPSFVKHMGTVSTIVDIPMSEKRQCAEFLESVEAMIPPAK